MQKKDILDLIYSFERETWKYNATDKLDSDMQYIYFIMKDVTNVSESDLKAIYNRLISIMGIIRFKHGFESIVIGSNPELESLKKIIDSISLNSGDIINQYNYISTMYNNFIDKNRKMDFIENKYFGIKGKEGLYLAVESLKSLITNDQYRQLLSSNQVNEVITDCIKLNNGLNIISIESKYNAMIKNIWENSLSNSIDENGKFRMLFSNICGGTLRERASSLINRPEQSSCSMISSNFIATYSSDIRRIGFIYPNNSEIIMMSAYDLCSNVFGLGSINKERGTLLATPEVLEKIGIMNAANKGEDLYSSGCYNEILVNAKPCGIVIIGLGEKDLNIDYYDAKTLSLEMNLPLYYIDTMKYKNKLSDADKYYIAFHSITSYLGIKIEDLLYSNDDCDIYGYIHRLIENYKEQIVNAFLSLKNSGNLNKDNMCQLMSNIMDIPKIDISKINGKSK